MAVFRGPGAHEPQLILEGMRAGKTFEQALAHVERLNDFRCEQWWIDLNRAAFIEAVSPPTPAKPAKPTK